MSSFLKINHSQAQQGRFVAPEGRYECIIRSARYDSTMGGTEYLRITLDIRNDVPQECQGEAIEWSVWRKKQPGPRDPDGFAIGTIQHLSKVVGFDNGQEFASIDDWMRALSGRLICVDIKHEEFNGRINARVSYSYETEHPNVQPGADMPAVNDDDSDFPF